MPEVKKSYLQILIDSRERYFNYYCLRPGPMLHGDGNKHVPPASRTQNYVCVIDQEEKSANDSFSLSPSESSSSVSAAQSSKPTIAMGLAMTVKSTGRLSTGGTILRQFSKGSSWSIDSQDGTGAKEARRAGEPFLYLSTWCYTELHSWMTEIRNALWPPTMLQGACELYLIN
jgi:hypothetical protein